MQTAKSVVSQLVTPPIKFNTRYSLVDAIPVKLGSLSMGYDNGSIQLIWTKNVGQEGIVIWSLNKFIPTLINAASNREFTPELMGFLQDLSNQMMPGFSWNFSKIHCFLRPEISKLDIGATLIMSTFVNIADLMKTKLHYLFENINKQFLPLFTFVVRGFNIDTMDIGRIQSYICFFVAADGTFYVEMGTTFLFNTSKLTKPSIDLIKNIGDNNDNNPINIAEEVDNDISNIGNNVISSNDNNNNNSISNSVRNSNNVMNSVGTTELNNSTTMKVSKEKLLAVTSDSGVFNYSDILKQVKLMAFTAIGLGITTFLSTKKMPVLNSAL